HDQYGHDADRQVDVKHPAPAEVIGDVAARRGTEDRGKAKDGAEESSDPRPLLRREEIANDGKDGGKEDAAEDSLDRAEDDELGHVLRETAESRGDYEADHARQQEWLPDRKSTRL